MHLAATQVRMCVKNYECVVTFMLPSAFAYLTISFNLTRVAAASLVFRHHLRNTNQSQSRRKDFFSNKWLWGCFPMDLWTSQKSSRKSFTLCLCPAKESLTLTFLDWLNWVLTAPRRDGLVRLLEDTGLDDWTTTLVAACTNEAAINVGIFNGVVPKHRQLATVGDSLVHILCTAHTLENCLKSVDRKVPNCETFNRCVVKLMQFYLQKKVEQKQKCYTEEAVWRKWDPLCKTGYVS